MAQPYPGNSPPAYTDVPPQQPYYPPQDPNAPPVYYAPPPNVAYNGPPQPVVQTIVVEQRTIQHHHVHWGES